jgi:sugar phosphate isomerase/epimerase
MTSYKTSNVAIQLYTLRDFCKTVSDLEKTAKKVREIGYQAVQASGIGVTPSEAKKVFADAGLFVCATHESSDLILNHPEQVCERLEQIGTKHTAYPYPSGVDFADENSIRNLAKQLDAAGAVLGKHGLTLSYHNHAQEFIRFGDSNILDYIYKATNPDYLKAELDTYWVQHGGGDPATWLEKLAGRCPLIHLKDYTVGLDHKPIYTEVGRGNLDWKRILTAAEKAGTQWLVVEQDTCPGDPFDSIKISYDYLAKLLGK